MTEPEAEDGALAKFSNSLRANWALLAQFASWVGVIVAAFLIKPPGLAVGDDRGTLNLAGFVVAALIGLLIVLAMRWRDQCHTRRWWIAGVVALSIAVALIYIYDRQIGLWTDRFQSVRVVIGDQWTDVGKRVHADYGSDTSRMLGLFGGNAGQLWEKPGLEARRRALAWLYVSCVAACAVTILSVIQAISCAHGQDAAPGSLVGKS